MSVYKSFASAADHVASWKAGGPRYAKVDGWTIDAIQAERDALQRHRDEVQAEYAEMARKAEQPDAILLVAPSDARDDQWWDASESLAQATIHVDPYCPPGTAVMFSQSGSLAAMSTAPDGTTKVAGPMEIFATTDGELHVRMRDGSVAQLTGEMLVPDPSTAPVADPVEARFVAMATAMADDPAMAVRCGVPAVIEEPASREELLAANRALMARLERVGGLALGHEDDVCPACGAVRR